jgi:CubicO group peptidase (beta-lactamase class C family)
MNGFASMLDDYVPERLSAKNLPGVAIGLIDGDGPADFHCYGLANVKENTPVTSSTVFQVASISKAVTAWGIMKLVEAGELDLDAPVQRYLSRWHFPASAFDSSKVTARLLLMHFGGTSLEGCGGTGYDDTWYSVDDVLYGRTPGLDPRHAAYAEKWGLDPEQYGEPVHLQSEPGTEFAYSGGGFCVLELLIEEIAGQDFTSFMGEQVLGPLGMSDATFEIGQAALPRVAQPYDDELTPMPLYRTNGKAAGGMYATIKDLSIFAAAEMEGAGGEPPGRGVLTPESVAEMHRPDRFAEHQADLDFYTGLGHYVIDIGPVRAVQHTGGNPGWRSVYTVIPGMNAGFACLINSAGGNDLWMDLLARWADTWLQQ